MKKTFIFLLLCICQNLQAQEYLLEEQDRRLMREELYQKYFDQPIYVEKNELNDRIEMWFRPKNLLHKQQYPEIAPLDDFQIFHIGNLKVTYIVRALEKTLGYKALYPKRIKPLMDKPVKLNQEMNRLSDIADYLKAVTNLHIQIYPEGKSIVVTEVNT